MSDFKLPQIMGILNVTPDSFSDGGRYLSVDAAVERGQQLVEEGADYLDIGGESTRPGAAPISSAEEIKRVLPVLEGMLRLCPTAKISVDTSNPNLMALALEAGAHMINDVRAFGASGMESVLDTLAQHKQVELCVMHMQGAPHSMQQHPHYGDVVQEVAGFLEQHVLKLEASGIERCRILVDPGIGFGKAAGDNIELMRHLMALRVAGCRQLVGVSRKSIIGYLVQQDKPADRLFGTLGALAAMAIQSVDVVRVHDVKATVECLRVMQAFWPAEGGSMRGDVETG